jgi:hypothetical protein
MRTVLLPKKFKWTASSIITFERDFGGIACFRQWKLLSFRKIFNVIIAGGKALKAWDESAAFFTPIGVILEHTVCRYTQRKIREIAATSWKRKDWLAPATLPAFSPLPGKQNPRTPRNGQQWQ